MGIPALEPPTSQPRVGMSVDIVCTVSTVSGVESSSVLISWTGPGGGSGGGPIINDSRMSISSTTSSGNNYTSSVQFTYLMEGDEDTYTCNVIILETIGSSSYTLPSLISKLASIVSFCLDTKHFISARVGLRPAHAWFLDIDLVREVCVCVSVCLCVRPRG